MPENSDPNVIYLGGVIITALAGVVVALWKVIDTMRKERNKQSDNHIAAMAKERKEYQDKTESLNKSIISHIETSSAEMIALMQTNMENQLNGHEALKEDIDEIDKKVTGLDKKVSLMEQKIKDTS